MSQNQTSPRCCAPAKTGMASKPLRPVAEARWADAATQTVDVPGGMALVGTDAPHLVVDEEGPLRQLKVKPFAIDAGSVTNARFAAFVAETGYRTEAERFGWSFVFHHQVPEEYGATDGVVGTEWWRRVEGATWRAPNGPGSEEHCLPSHPVVQVSWADARAFAKWAGGRLPSEAEWEHAARGGLGDVPYPWGDKDPDDAAHFPCNIWQGDFPHMNTGADGWLTAAPSISFEPNGFGLYNMCGNVWEWTADAFRLKSLRKAAKERNAAMRGYKIAKGGSFLCHRSYCYRYRIAARSGHEASSTTTHQGFRLVYPV